MKTRVRRGEIYFVENKIRKDYEETKTHRPALVIAEPEEGDPYENVNVVYLTNHPKIESIKNVVIEKTNNGKCEGSVAICGKHYDILGERFEAENYACRVSEEDMRRIDEALLKSVGLAEVLKSSQENVLAVAEPYEYEPVQDERIMPDMEFMECKIKARFYEQKYNELLAMIMNR